MLKYEVGIALIPVRVFEEGMKKAMGYVYTDANKNDQQSDQ